MYYVNKHKKSSVAVLIKGIKKGHFILIKGSILSKCNPKYVCT